MDEQTNYLMVVKMSASISNQGKGLIQNLINNGVLASTFDNLGNICFYLQTPFYIVPTKDSCHELLKSYHDRYETGGILLCKPDLRNGERYLIIHDVIFIKNISRWPENSYEEDPEEYKKALSLCFDTFCIPIEFHTHPKINDADSLWDILTHPGTSPGDQEWSNPAIKILDHYLVIPNVLIEKPLFSDRIFFGAYGGLIAPADFGEYVLKVTGKTWGEIIKISVEKFKNFWGKASLLQKVLTAAVVVGGAGLLIRYHKIVFPTLVALLFAMLSPSMALEIQKGERIPKYFTELKEEVTLLIPEYNPTEDLKDAPIKLRYKGS